MHWRDLQVIKSSIEKVDRTSSKKDRHLTDSQKKLTYSLKNLRLLYQYGSCMGKQKSEIPMHQFDPIALVDYIHGTTLTRYRSCLSIY